MPMRLFLLPILTAAVLAPLPASAQTRLEDWAQERAEAARNGSYGSDSSTVNLRDGTRSFDDMMQEEEEANKTPSAESQRLQEERAAAQKQKEEDEASIQAGIPNSQTGGDDFEKAQAATAANAGSGKGDSSATPTSTDARATGRVADPKKQVRQVYKPAPTLTMPRRAIVDERIDDGYVQSIRR